MSIARTGPLAGPVPHPGEVLKDELEARGLSAHALSIALRLPASRISQIVRGQRGITPETALRLARYFGGSAGIWLRLQVTYDLAHGGSRTCYKDRRRGHPIRRLIWREGELSFDRARHRRALTAPSDSRTSLGHRCVLPDLRIARWSARRDHPRPDPRQCIAHSGRPPRAQNLDWRPSRPPW